MGLRRFIPISVPTGPSSFVPEDDTLRYERASREVSQAGMAWETLDEADIGEKVGSLSAARLRRVLAGIEPQLAARHAPVLDGEVGPAIIDRMADPLDDRQLVRDPQVLQRMQVAFDLYQVAEEMMRQNLRRRNPTATEEEIEQGIRDWLHRRPGAEHGDGVGRPRSAPFASG